MNRTLLLCSVIVVGSCWLVLASGVYEVRIKPGGDKFTRSLGSSMVFTCEVCDLGGTGEDRVDGVIKIQWFDQHRNEIKNTNNRRLYLENDGTRVRKLYITRIENRDAGRYFCLVKVGSFADEKSVELALFKDITFDHAPNPQHPAIYTDALIECQVSGLPVPDVSWKYNESSITLGGRYTKEVKGLRIRNITRADNGNYTCCAEVDAEGRYDDKRITVVVHVPPKVIQGPGTRLGIAGEELSMYCKADGDPMPSFEFLKNNKQKLLTSSSSDRIQVDGHLGKLTFRSLKKEDEGQYTCKALNDVGEDFHSGSLKVHVPPHISDMTNISVNEGQTALLTCKSHGDPTPNMTFHKVGHPEYRIGQNEGERIMMTKKTQNVLELTVKKSGPHDSSEYVCKSKNVAGEDSSSAHIIVHYKPKFAIDHTKLAHSWVGRHHNVTCHANAHPPPTFQWMRHERVLTNNDTFHIYTSAKNTSLQIRVKEADQSWIFGEYICRASNNKGSSDLKIKLNKASLPDAPTHVDVIENTPNLLVLSVTPPKTTGGVKLVGYRVGYDRKLLDFNFPEYEGRSSDSTNIRNENEIKLENLKPATQYNFKIQARNEVGAGQSYDFSLTTKNITKPYPVKVTSSKQGKDPWTYKLTWEKPKTGGMPIKEYVIRYKKVRVRTDGTQEALADWLVDTKKDNVYKPLLEHNIQDLNPQSNYQVEIIAKTDRGDSGTNENFVFRTASEHFKMGQYQGSSNSVHCRLAYLITFYLSAIIVIYE